MAAMPIIDYRESLHRLDSEQAALCERIGSLTPTDLEKPSNLTDWSITDVAVHITRLCDSILLAVTRATTGDRTPAFGPAARPRELEIRSMTPPEWAAQQRREYAEICQIVNGLSEPDAASMIFPHPQGDRSIGWFCTQLLAETAFHRWDLDHSLGATGSLAPETEGYLRTFLLNPAEHLFVRCHTDGGSETFTLSDGESRWVLRADPETTTVTLNGKSEGAVITGQAGWLSLAPYGRVRIDTAAFTIDGPADTADRFAKVFGPPS
jgi:uncharacterized protein (TIGR03083 family)